MTNNIPNSKSNNQVSDDNQIEQAKNCKPSNSNCNFNPKNSKQRINVKNSNIMLRHSRTLFNDEILKCSSEKLPIQTKSPLPIELYYADDELNKIVSIFNRSPNRGIPLLCKYYKSDIIAAPIIAHILHTTPGLNNDMIISYLTSEIQTNTKCPPVELIFTNLNEDTKETYKKCTNYDEIKSASVLSAYFGEMNLKVSFMDAMRTCLGATNFLNCSINQIDFILSVFSDSFYQQNKSLFNSFYVYYVCLSIILLNNQILYAQSLGQNLEISSQQFDFIIKHIFPEQYLNIYSSQAVYRRIKQHPIPQKIFDPYELQIQIDFQIEKKISKLGTIFSKRNMSINNTRILFSKILNGRSNSILMIKPNMIIQKDTNHQKRLYIRSSSYVYKNKDKNNDRNSYRLLLATTKRQLLNGTVDDYSNVSSRTTSNNASNTRWNRPHSPHLDATMSSSSFESQPSGSILSSMIQSSSDSSFGTSHKGESLTYVTSTTESDENTSSEYKKNINEISLKFSSTSECGLCEFALKKALLLSLFVNDSPLLTIPSSFLQD